MSLEVHCTSENNSIALIQFGSEIDLGPTVGQVADREPLCFSFSLEPFMSVYADESPEC